MKYELSTTDKRTNKKVVLSMFKHIEDVKCAIKDSIQDPDSFVIKAIPDGKKEVVLNGRLPEGKKK